MGVLIDSAATVPDVVRAAQSRAARISFELSSEDLVGRLLAVLAAATPASGRILEIGTGVGVGTSWLLAGLAGRVDVEVVSVEANPSLARVAQDYPWPSFVRLLTGSIFELYEELGQFDLIFADSGAGKWQGLDRTLGALQPGGLLVMDDMTPLALRGTRGAQQASP